MLSGIVAILVILIVLLNTHRFQNFLTGKATGYLSKKLGTTVHLEEINLTFPTSLYLKNFFIADLNKDTLAYVHELTVNISMWSLLKNQALIHEIDLNGATVHLNRSEVDSNFNFDFIASAFESGKPPKTKKPGDTTAAFNILLQKIKLQSAYFTIDDELGGMHGAARIGILKADFKEFNIAKGKIIAGDLEWNDSYAHFSQNKVTAPDTSASTPLTLQLGADKISLQNLDLSYADTSTRLSLTAKIAALDAEPKTIDIGNLIFDFNTLNIENTDFFVGLAKDADSSTPQTDDDLSDTSSAGLMARAGRLSLNHFHFRYDDKSAVPANEGIDYSHLDIREVTADVSNVFFQGETIEVDIAKLTAKEKSGMNIRSANGQFRMSPDSIYLNNCLLATDKSIIRNKAGIHFESLNKLSNDPGSMGLFADLDNAAIAISDIILIYPPLKENEYIKPSLGRILNVDGKISGTLNNLQFSNLKLSTQSTNLFASGSIKGMPEVDKMVFDIKLSSFTSTKTELVSLLPKDLLPTDIEIPESFSVSGQYFGTLDNFQSTAVISSSFGNGVAVVNMKPASTGTNSYSAKVDLENFDLGRFLKQEETIGKLSMNANIIGEGFSLDEMDVKVDATIKSAEIQGYTYKNLKARGAIANEFFTGEASIDDEAVSFDFKGKASLNKDKPDFDFDLDLRHANLKTLNFYDDELIVSGKVKGDFTGSDLASLNGFIQMSEAHLIRNGTDYPLDSVNLLAVSEKGKYEWTLRSGFLDATYTGSSSAALGVPLLINHFNYYFNQKKYQEADTLGNQQFDFSIAIQDKNNLLQVFIPDLEYLKPFSINGTFDGAGKYLKLASTPTSIGYQGIHIDSMRLQASSTPEKLFYNISVDTLRYDTIDVQGISLGGYVQNDSVNAMLKVAPDSNNLVLELGGSLVPEEENFRFRLNPSQVYFDNEQWSVAPDNYLITGPSGIYFNNLKIFKDQKSVSIHSETQTPNAPVTLSFKDFELGILSQAVDTSGFLLSGVANGDLYIQDIQKMKFTSGITIDSLHLLGENYGDLTLQARNETPGKYELDLSLLGSNNGVKATGYYFSGEQGNELHFDLAMDSLDFSLVEPFTQGYIKRPNGNVSGDLRIRGTTSKPSINGSIQFTNSGFILSYTNAIIIMGNEPIRFDETGIHFSDFTMKDIFKDPAVLNGDLLTTDYRDFQFALDLVTTNFVAMSSSKQVNPELFGIIRIDSETKIRGDMNKPAINTKVKLRKGTTLNYVYSGSDTVITTDQGIVEFIQLNEKLDSILAASRDTLVPPLSGFDISAAIEVDDSSEFRIVIDPVTGDKLRLRGQGSLTYDLNANGTQSLAGLFEISEGDYTLKLYELPRKEFKVKNGSSITWTGDPLDAEIDITAYMDVKAVPAPLMADEMAGATDAELAPYKSQMSFVVNLNLRGDLMQPDINFNIDMPEKERNKAGGAVYQKLVKMNSDETQAELNKQVFALLVLGTFVSPDPFASGSSTNYIEEVARNSASSILTSQLNKLSSSYLKGLNLEFDLTSYSDVEGTSSQYKTQVSVGFRQELFSNRLQLYVGSYFYPEGKTGATGVNYAEFGGDFALEYLASLDGRYRLSFFRRDTYEDIFEGQVTEMGGSVIYTKDFNKLRDLFKREMKAKREKKKDDNDTE